MDCPFFLKIKIFYTELKLIINIVISIVSGSCWSLAGCGGGNTRTICDVSDFTGGADGTAVCKAHNAGDEETLDCCWTDPTSAGVVTNGACDNSG